MQAQKYWAGPGNPSPLPMITQQQTIACPLAMSLDAGALPNSDCPKRKANVQQEQGECPSVAAGNHQRN